LATPIIVSIMVVIGHGCYRLTACGRVCLDLNDLAENKNRNIKHGKDAWPSLPMT
jgi:hypothetical protein